MTIVLAAPDDDGWSRWDHCTAIGDYAVSDGNYAVAIGHGAEAHGDHAVAIGHFHDE